MMKKVVAAVDDTAEARSALRFAKMVADAGGADLDVAAVFSKTLFDVHPRGDHGFRDGA